MSGVRGLSTKSLQEYRDNISGMTPIATILDAGTDITYARDMARLLLSLFATIILCSFLFSQSENKQSASLFTKYYKDVESFGPPSEGSKAEKQVIEYLADLSKVHGLTSTPYTIGNARDYHSFSSSLSIHIQGKSDRVVAFIFPLDAPDQKRISDDYDPYSGAAFCALLMDLIKKDALPFSVNLEVLGAENGIRDGLGTRAFLENRVDRNLSSVFFISFDGGRQDWKLIHGGQGKVTPSWLLTTVLEALRASGLHTRIPYIESEMYRLGMGPATNIGPYLRANIPAIQLIPDVSSKPVTIAESAQGLASFVEKLLSSPDLRSFTDTPPSWDGNYLVLTESGGIIVPERTIALVFLFSVVGCLILVFIRRSARHRYVKSVLRNLPSFFVILTGSFFTFLLGNLITVLLLPDFSRDPAYLGKLDLFIAAKALIGLSLMIGMLRFLNRWLSRQSSFYSGAAFFTSVASLITVSIFNITFGIYFVFSTFAIGLANLTRFRIVKAVLLFVGLLAIVWPTILALRQYPDELIDTLLIRGLFPGTILITAVCLPFVFMICRLLLLNPLFHGSTKRMEPVFWIALSFSAVFIASYASIYIHQNANGFVDISVSRVVDTQSHSDLLEVRKAGFLPPGKIEYNGVSYETHGRSSVDFAVQNESAPGIAIESSSRSFLGRKTLDITMSGSKTVKRVEAWFDSDNDLIVHSLNFPYRYIDTRHIQIMIGKNPPLPLSLELTIPDDSHGVLRLRTTLADQAEFVSSTDVKNLLECDTVDLARIEWK